VAYLGYLFVGNYMRNIRFIRWSALSAFCMVVAMGSAQAEDKKAATKKPFRVIDAVCDFDSTEIAAEKGQFICLYICRDPDHSKMFQVYSNSSIGKCPTPLKTKIKQTIKEEKKAAPPPAH
jgi:hypothetical protein